MRQIALLVEKFWVISEEGGCEALAIVMVPLAVVCCIPFFVLGCLRRTAQRCRKCCRERLLKRWARKRGYVNS